MGDAVDLVRAVETRSPVLRPCRFGPAQNLEAEEAVLGGILLDPCNRPGRRRAAAGSVLSERHREIFRTALMLLQPGQTNPT